MAIPVDRCIDLAVAEIRAMADACRGADPATPVPTCPGWDLAELERHAGAVHRWAATMVAQLSQERLSRRTLPLGIPEDPAALPDWLAAGADVLADALRAADPDAAMWAWGSPERVAFWPRRMVHETAVHRCDAELALGWAVQVDAEVAVDGVDELLGSLLPSLAAYNELRGGGESLAFVAADAGAAWLVRLRPDGAAHERVESPAVDGARGGDGVDGADATLAAPAADLLLTLYRRRLPTPGEVSGDPALVNRWLACSSF